MPKNDFTWKILTPLQKMPKNVGDLGKFFVAKGFKKLPKVQKSSNLVTLFGPFMLRLKDCMLETWMACWPRWGSISNSDYSASHRLRECGVIKVSGLLLLKCSMNRSTMDSTVVTSGDSSGPLSSSSGSTLQLCWSG